MGRKVSSSPGPADSGYWLSRKGSILFHKFGCLGWADRWKNFGDHRGYGQCRVNLFPPGPLWENRDVILLLPPSARVRTGRTLAWLIKVPLNAAGSMGCSALRPGTGFKAWSDCGTGCHLRR